MKIKEGLVLREAAGSFIVMNTRGDLSFNGMITLNETGAFIWNCIEEGLTEEEIASKITDIYDIDRETAVRDLKIFKEKMSGAGIIE